MCALFKSQLLCILFIICDVTHIFAVMSARNYGVIIDAGSSGSRVRIYSWIRNSWSADNSVNLPVIQEVRNPLRTFEKRPGLSSYINNSIGLKNYTKSLICEAKSVVPADQYDVTHIFVFATAGMRLLAATEADDVMNEMRDLMKSAINPFKYSPSNSRIISGEEEGAFAWIALNYLRNHFSSSDDVNQAGILELGGASAQIAFHHPRSILADKFPVRIRGKIYPLYVHSYLGFGQNEVQDKLDEIIYAHHQKQLSRDNFVSNPCMLKDDTRNATIQNAGSVRFVGISKPLECLKHIDQIVYKTNKEEHCLPKPCAIGNVYQPAIDPTMDYFALSSVFKFTLKTLKILRSNESKVCLEETRQAALEFCSLNIVEALNHTKSADKSNFLSTECMMGLYIPKLLSKGYTFPNNSCQVHVQDEIKGEKPEWTLGALIYEMERRDKLCYISVSSSSHASPVQSQQLTVLALIVCLATYFRFIPVTMI